MNVWNLIIYYPSLIPCISLTLFEKFNSFLKSHWNSGKCQIWTLNVFVINGNGFNHNLTVYTMLSNRLWKWNIHISIAPSIIIIMKNKNCGNVWPCFMYNVYKSIHIWYARSVARFRIATKNWFFRLFSYYIITEFLQVMSKHATSYIHGILLKLKTRYL